MFTVIWHYEGDGIGSFLQAKFRSYSAASYALRCTTLLVPKGQPVPVSAMLVGELGAVIDFWAPVSEPELIERF